MPKEYVKLVVYIYNWFNQEMSLSFTMPTFLFIYIYLFKTKIKALI